jgi:hypothetical protein
MPGNDPEKPRLEVYLQRSVLVQADGQTQEFKEGMPTPQAQARLERIRSAFEKGFLVKIVEECRKNPAAAGEGIDPSMLQTLTRLVDSVTSEVGRGLVGLTVLQLAIKSIAPDQSIRLHKGGGRGESFSWADGIPMRVLDNTYNTPVLRQFDLIKLNADGVFMTRSLAENYPYSKLYKAALRGARAEWLDIVDLIEKKQLDPLLGLKQMISMLFNRSDGFKTAAANALAATKKAVAHIASLDDGIRFIKGFVHSSAYSARVFEIAMHALFQVLEDAGAFGGFLKPLSQMRSANKKHGNIGDIEITATKRAMDILESWDAKYGKPYLRDELDELNEKLSAHPETEIAGFVVDGEPNFKDEIAARKAEVEEIHGVRIFIMSFDGWVRDQAKRVRTSGKDIAVSWIIAFAESLCQARRDRAPIDEPSDAWVNELTEYAKTWVRSGTS